MTMEQTINRNLLTYAVSTAIFCKRCGHILDARQTVSATLRVPGSNAREFILCASCWDKIRLELHDLAMGVKGEVDVLDGREVFRKASRKRQEVK